MRQSKNDRGNYLSKIASNFTRGQKAVKKVGHKKREPGSGLLSSSKSSILRSMQNRMPKKTIFPLTEIRYPRWLLSLVNSKLWLQLPTHLALSANNGNPLTEDRNAGTRSSSRNRRSSKNFGDLEYTFFCHIQIRHQKSKSVPLTLETSSLHLVH